MRAGSKSRLALVLVGVSLLTAGAAAATETVPLQGLRAEVAALLMQGVAGGGLPIAAAVFPQPPDGGEKLAELAFLLELPAAQPDETQREHALEIYAYAVDDAGEVAAHFAVTLSDWPADGEGLKVAGRLEVAPGDLSLRFLAWDPAARRYGMAVRRLTLDAAAASPRIVEECAGWSAAEGDVPGLPTLSARPVLVSGETRRLSLGRPAPPAGWSVRLAGDREGSATQEVAAAPTVSGDLEFAVPELPPGVYQLSVGPVGGGTWRSVTLEVWLVPALPPAAGGCRRSWPRVLQEARSEALAAGPEPSSPGGKRPVRQLTADYEALLARLAGGGDLASAAAELAELESSIVGEEPGRTRLLLNTELKLARSLAERDPRCLLPLVALHAETFRAHHGAGRFPLATHSRRLAVAIAELAVELLAASEERSLVAMAVTGLADMVETRRASIEAQRLLERALVLDDSQEGTRLLLAVSYERKGRYLDARQEFEELVASNSAHHEARVRLAILLRRIGDVIEAERLLRTVVAERPPDWLLSLAYQTLAQLLIRDARLTEAVAELEEARDRLPGDQALSLLLAYALDRSGERREVQETLAELPLGQAGVTPRYRYSDEPAAALGLLRETLRQSVTVRLPILAVVLGVDRVGGPVE